MGKKRSRSKKVSAGVHSNVSAGTLRLVRQGRTPGEKLAFKLEAWRRGQNPWMSVDTGAVGSNVRFKRIRMNEIYGDPKKMGVVV